MCTVAADVDHDFFGAGPVVGLVVDDVDAVRERLEAAGIEFLTPVERAEHKCVVPLSGPGRERLRDHLDAATVESGTASESAPGVWSAASPGDM